MRIIHVALCMALFVALASRLRRNSQTMRRLRRHAALVQAWLLLQARLRPAVSASRICVPLCALSDRLIVVALSVGRGGTRVVARFNAPWARWLPLQHATKHVPCIDSAPTSQQQEDVGQLSPFAGTSTEAVCPGFRNTDSPVRSLQSSTSAATVERVVACSPLTDLRGNHVGRNSFGCAGSLVGDSSMASADWAAVVASPPELENSRPSLVAVTGRSRKRQRRQRSTLSPLAESAWPE